MPNEVEADQQLKHLHCYCRSEQSELEAASEAIDGEANDQKVSSQTQGPQATRTVDSRHH